MKKRTVRTFVPMSAVATAFGMAAPAAHATPLFAANFPASWNGSSTNVVDQSGAGNTGFQSGTATFTTSAVPPGATAGTGSMALTSVGGIKVTPTKLLNNTAIANAGGFSYEINFLWDGTDNTGFGHAQKLIDYAGTDSLQLVTTAGSATLEGVFTGDTGASSTTPVSTTILPNTWYDAKLEFDATGTSGGDVNGTASLFLNGVLVSTGAATKGTYGDSLNRPIAIGELGYGHVTSIVGLHGDIYSATVQLVPEPSMLALGALGGLALRRSRRRKSKR